MLRLVRNTIIYTWGYYFSHDERKILMNTFYLINGEKTILMTEFARKGILLFVSENNNLRSEIVLTCFFLSCGKNIK